MRSRLDWNGPNESAHSSVLRTDKNKPYALHAPGVQCIGIGKARKPCEFGVKVSLTVTHLCGSKVVARSFPGTPFDGNTLAGQLEQTKSLTRDPGRQHKQTAVDLRFRGMTADKPNAELIHGGKYKSLTEQQRNWLRWPQAIEQLIDHTKGKPRHAALSA